MTPNLPPTIQTSQVAEELATAGLPPEVLQWLAKLKLLYGLPFNYLVPDEQFLPPETIRFFSIDPDWMASVSDGAMSIGRHYNGATTPPVNLHSDLVHLKLLHQKPDQHVHNIRRRQLSLADTPPPETAKGMSGFLLRSAVVAGWKSMDVLGYPKGSSPYDNKKDNSPVIGLELLRLERLSSMVMLGIFRGDLFELVLHQPPEAIHFGFIQKDVSKNTVNKNLRVPTTNWDDPDTQYNSQAYQDKLLENAFVDAEARVLDMMQLSKALAAQLNAVGPNGAPAYYQATPTNDNFKDHLVSSDFALEMVEGVGLVSFINEAS